MIVICDTSTGLQAEMTSDQLDFIYFLMSEFIAKDDEPPNFVSDFQVEVLYRKLLELRLGAQVISEQRKEEFRKNLDEYLRFRVLERARVKSVTSAFAFSATGKIFTCPAPVKEKCCVWYRPCVECVSKL